MYKNILVTVMLSTSFYPAWAGSGHDHGEHGHDHGEHNHSKPDLVITPISSGELKVNEENEVFLFIQDKEAKPVDVSEFKVVHMRPIHLLIIEPGLNDYHHEHPTQKATGQYAFSFTPQTDCSYRVWMDVQRKGSHQNYIPVDLKGAEKCNAPIEKTVSLETFSQGYNFKLDLEGELMLNEATFAKVSITKDGQQVDFLEPVMGAFAHMVGFYENYESIAHIHPLGKEPKGHGERGGPLLRFQIKPELEGYLKLFAQVQIDGKQIIAPFGVMVK